MAKLDLKNAVIRHGMAIVPGARANSMAKDSALHPRNGAAKRLTNPAPAFGMQRQTKGALHPHLHGRPIDDETADKLCSTGQNVKTHPGMFSHSKSNAGDRLRGKHNSQSGNAILAEAARLGRKPS